MRYLLLVILWIAWCALHSVLISLAFTGWLQAKFPKGFRFYRILYNFIALISLLPVLFYTYALRSAPLIDWEGAWRIVPISLGVAALFFFVAGGRRYDFLQFMGLRQLKNENACSVLTEDCSIDTSGVLSAVRHPWYSAGMLVVWARPLDASAILTNLVICAYFVVGAILEERKLKTRFGRQYTDYQQEVSMFLPIKWAQRYFKR